MAGLKKRGRTYYITFTRRVEGVLDQRAFSLGTGRRDHAERLKTRYEDQHRLGEIDPFGGWSPRKTRVVADPKPAHGPLLRDAVALFIGSRSHVRERTRRGYTELARGLVESVGASMPVRHVTEADLRQYAFQPHLSTASQTSYLRFCRMLFRWLVENGHVAKDPAAGVRYPKRDDRVSDKTISEAQFRAVLRAHRAEERARRLTRSSGDGQPAGPMLHPWFRPMVATYFYGGLRAREGVELRWEKVDFEEESLRVTGSKSGRERTVHVQRRLLSKLRAWHAYTGRPSSGLVFSKGRWEGEDAPLNTDHVSRTYKRYARAAKLPASANLHGLRHSCATELLRAGVPINEVAKFLGHRYIETTRIYEHLNDRDMKATFARLGL